MKKYFDVAYIFSVSLQNRCKNVFNKGFYVCARGLDIENLTKTSLVYSVLYFNLGGWCFVGGSFITQL